MAFDNDTKLIKNLEYEARIGKFVRQVRSSQIFNITGGTQAGNAAFPGLASGSVAGNREIWINSICVSASAAVKRFDITAGTSTLFQIVTGTAGPYTINTPRDSPLAVVGGTTIVTVDVAASAGSGTVTAFITGIIVPQSQALEKP